jgi:hypothetical protein
MHKITFKVEFVSNVLQWRHLYVRNYWRWASRLLVEGLYTSSLTTIDGLVNAIWPNALLPSNSKHRPKPRFSTKPLWVLNKPDFQESVQQTKTTIRYIVGLYINMQISQNGLTLPSIMSVTVDCSQCIFIATYLERKRHMRV